MKTVNTQQGQRITVPDRFEENYDSSLNIRRCGRDNLYPQHLREFYEASPTLHSCANRLQEFLFGEGAQSSIISNEVLSAILKDYSIFNGFVLFVQYNGLGDIARVTYIPFETVRLGEQGADGKFTYVYYCPDWSMTTTINKKKVGKQNITKYWLFTDNVETRLRRMQDEDYTCGEVLYFSNTISYPSENARSVLTYISAEIGVSNVLYRDVRTSFLQNSVLAIPKQSDEDGDEFAEQLASLQGDLNSYKILCVEFSSKEDKPEVLSLNSEDYTTRVTTVGKECRDNIVRAYGQEQFIRLQDGSLGLAGNVIADVYTFYNFQLRTKRKEIVNCLRRLDPTIDLKEVNYPYKSA